MSNIVNKRLVRELLGKGLTPRIVSERAGCSIGYVYELKGKAPPIALPPIEAVDQPDVCPSCGEGKTYVYDSRKDLAGLLRRRKCSNCEAKWNTRETIVKILRRGSTHI